MSWSSDCSKRRNDSCKCEHRSDSWKDKHDSDSCKCKRHSDSGSCRCKREHRRRCCFICFHCDCKH